ncbi:GNAT family N-acetyltransferase [Jannaschia sp. LMIT008]|uniref:GNAT family N-acetyltransferase n=1 Tax=Jannaschia maritima TaxID=3032585 RepID=UPI0028113713|nr:GNAT family N-acetyltransferase [Jannaschia sp. LMIT008]
MRPSPPTIRAATCADLPCIQAIRHGTSENRLLDPARAPDALVAWYLAEAIFLVSEAHEDVRGFVCANHQTGLIWALFVQREAQGRGHGTALLGAALDRLRWLGHRQAFLSTGAGTGAAAFYRARGWRCMGLDLEGDAAFVLPL